MQPVIERAQLNRDEWLDGPTRICLEDVRKMFDERGTPIAITKLGDSEAAAIAAFEVYDGRAARSDVSAVRSRTSRVSRSETLPDSTRPLSKGRPAGRTKTCETHEATL